MNNTQLPDLAGAKIVLGVCGSIAIYKVPYLVRELCALGAQVRVVMTQSALAFMQPLTFQALSGEDVRCDLFDAQAERAMGHIELARWADYLLIAPASADFIAKMTQGRADDLLSTLYLATRAAVIVCPAMNQHMWEHPATAANCALLRERDVLFCGPAEGEQACGDLGMGRMAEPDTIIATLRLYPIRQILCGHDLMITAGPTREALDPVRYLTNHSSGKMGYALAQAAQIAGARVTLISGPCALPIPAGVVYCAVTSAKAMLTTVQAHLKPGMIFIGAAAVADYGVAEPLTEKIKRQSADTMTLSLHKNPDILATVVASQQAALVVGFAAETQDVLRHAAEKLKMKNLDMILANQVGEGLAFDADENQVTVLTPDQQMSLTLAPKIILAGQIIGLISEVLKKKMNIIPVRSNYEPFYSN